MTIYEAKSKINEIQNTTSDYQHIINGIQTKLMTLIDDVSNVNKSILGEIKEDSIVSHSNNSSNNIISKINETLAKSSATLDILSTDATKYIREIVDSYNSSLKPDSEEERLYYIEIKLSSVSGCPSNDDNDVNTGGKGPNHIYLDGTGGKDGKQVTVDYYFDMLRNKKVYSSKIKNWDSYVNNFLEKNSLTKVIDTIIVNGKVIKVKLKNGKEYKFKNITNSLDLLKALSKKIEKDQNNNK